MVDQDTFGSVMECSEGPDLDMYLKEHGTIRESDAKIVLMQLLNGLLYLHHQPERIIHYDVKPVNILFTCVHTLQIKITDFGLCKILRKRDRQDDVHSDSDADCIELTSQGTGTYWYQPPECFLQHEPTPTSMYALSSSSPVPPSPSVSSCSFLSPAPRVSPKVDIWAVGIVFYQMLYGRRPYGDGLSQKQIWNTDFMHHISQVDFPARPSISIECKDFIRICLERNVSMRSDILGLMTDAYIQRMSATQHTAVSSPTNVQNAKRRPNVQGASVHSAPTKSDAI